MGGPLTPDRPALLWLALVALGATPAPAEDSVALEQVVVEGRGSDLVGAARSASEGLIGRAELDLRPLLRRGDLLETVPGLVLTQHSGGGKANQYFVRGFNLDHGTDWAVEVAGMPVNQRTHAHGQGYSDLNFIVPEFVESVTYRKGPYFAEAGDFASAGGARVELRSSLEADFLQLESGSHGYARLVTGLSGRHEAGRWIAGVELTRHDGPWETPEDFERANLFFRQLWNGPTGSTWRLTALGYQGNWQATDQIPLRLLETGGIGRFGSLDPTSGGESWRGSVSLDWQRAAAGTASQASLYLIRSSLDLYSNFTYFLDDPENGDQFNQRDRRTIVGGEFRHEAPTPGPRNLTTRFGLQWRGDLISELGLHRTRGRQRLATVREDAVDEWSAGLWGELEWRPAPPLRLTGGARVDQYWFDVEARARPNRGTASDRLVSPKLTAAYQVAPQAELYLSGGAGFHSNDARGTTLTIDPATGDAATPVDPLARSHGAEVGWRYGRADRWVTTVALWTLDQDSELVFVGDTGGTEPAEASRRFGVEWTNFIRHPSGWTAEVDVAWTRARYRRVEEDRIPNSLSAVVSAAVGYARAEGPLLSLRLRSFGPQPLLEDNSVRAPSSTTINLLLGWRWPRWQVSLEVLNLADRRNDDIAYAYESRLPGEPPAGVRDLHVHPAEPRAFRLALRRAW